MSISGIAASGMAAAAARLTASAANTANANVLGPVPNDGPPIQLMGGPQPDVPPIQMLGGPEAERPGIQLLGGPEQQEPTIQLLGGPPVDVPSVYQPYRVEQSATVGGGSLASYHPLVPGYTLRYAPEMPFADASGMVAAPKVDLAQEAVERVTAALAYQANLRVLGAAADQDRMTITLLG